MRSSVVASFALLLASGPIAWGVPIRINGVPDGASRTSNMTDVTMHYPTGGRLTFDSYDPFNLDNGIRTRLFTRTWGSNNTTDQTFTARSGNITRQFITTLTRGEHVILDVRDQMAAEYSPPAAPASTAQPAQSSTTLPTTTLPDMTLGPTRIESTSNRNVRITVTLPRDARVWVDEVPTTSTGTERLYEHDGTNLTRGTRYWYVILIETGSGTQRRARNFTVNFSAGDRITLNIPADLNPTQAAASSGNSSSSPSTNTRTRVTGVTQTSEGRRATIIVQLPANTALTASGLTASSTTGTSRTLTSMTDLTAGTPRTFDLVVGTRTFEVEVYAGDTLTINLNTYLAPQ